VIEMIARMNLKDHSAFFQIKEKKVSKKPFVNLQLTYYYLLIRQTGGDRGEALFNHSKNDWLPYKKKEETAYCFEMNAAWKERLHNQKS